MASRRSFGALKVAEQISFAVGEGEALGIIGPNGAGKSTLFNLITGNIAADSGRIRFPRQRRDARAADGARACRAWAAPSRSRSPSRS